jgi:hypothetical protein
VSFAAITLCVASQRVFIIVVVVYFVMTQSGNFWIYPRIGFWCCVELPLLKHTSYMNCVSDAAKYKPGTNQIWK